VVPIFFCFRGGGGGGGDVRLSGGTNPNYGSTGGDNYNQNYRTYPDATV
jgi:hypothetical protein